MNYRIVIALLAFSLIVSFSYYCEPIYDDHGHMGDETMSMALAHTAMKTRFPSYGYLASGELRSMGTLVWPGYVLAYGVPLQFVEPLNRIDAARVISRIFNALSLFLLLFSIVYVYSRKTGKSPWDIFIMAVAGVSVAYLFLFTENFVFVGSFARVDAISVFAVCVYVAAIAFYATHKTDMALFIVGVAGILSYYTNYMVGALCAGAFAGVFASHFLTSPFKGLLKRAFIVISALLAVSVAGFFFSYFVLMSAKIHSDSPVTYTTLVNLVKARAQGSFSEFIGFIKWHPELWRLFIFTTVSTLILAAWGASSEIVAHLRRKRGGDNEPESALRWRWGVLGPSIETLFLGFVSPTFIFLMYWLASVTKRVVYSPIFASLILGHFLVAIMRIEKFTPLRVLLILGLPMTVFLYNANSVIGYKPINKYPAYIRSWLVGYNHTAGIENPNRLTNASRQEHLQSLFQYLDSANIRSAIVTDPMFSAMLGDSRHFYYFYDKFASREVEYGSLKMFHEKFNVAHIISNRFGEEDWASQYGPRFLTPTLIELKNSTESRTVQYDGGKLSIRKVFQSSSSSPELAGIDYKYGNFVSTPFYVYEVTFGN